MGQDTSDDERTQDQDRTKVAGGPPQLRLPVVNGSKQYPSCCQQTTPEDPIDQRSSQTRHGVHQAER